VAWSNALLSGSVLGVLSWQCTTSIPRAQSLPPSPARLSGQPHATSWPASSIPSVPNPPSLPRLPDRHRNPRGPRRTHLDCRCRCCCRCSPGADRATNGRRRGAAGRAQQPTAKEARRQIEGPGRK
jgi:hypothetical protein